MIVGMKYNIDGSRYISTIAHGADWTPKTESERAKYIAGECEEVYIIPIDINHKEFINSIVLNGCRII